MVAFIIGTFAGRTQFLSSSGYNCPVPHHIPARIFLAPVCAQTERFRSQRQRQESLLRKQYHEQQVEKRTSRFKGEGHNPPAAEQQPQRRPRPNSNAELRGVRKGANTTASYSSVGEPIGSTSKSAKGAKGDEKSAGLKTAGSASAAKSDSLSGGVGNQEKKKRRRRRKKRREFGTTVGKGDAIKLKTVDENNDGEHQQRRTGRGANSISRVEGSAIGQRKVKGSMRKHQRRSGTSNKGGGSNASNGEVKNVTPKVHSRRGRSPVLAKLLYGNDQQVRHALEELASGNVLMSIHEFNDVLSSLNRQRKMRAAVGLVRVSRNSSFGKHIGPLRTVKTFTIMLDIFGKSRQLDQAFSLFYEMQRESSLEPTQVTYNALISSCSRNNEPELAHEVFEDMEQAGLQGDKFTYASLIDAHAKRGDIERAFAVSNLMEESGVVKDQTIYSALMEACGRARRLDRALYVFEDMKRNGVWPNLISYSVLLDCCANAREPYKAFDLFAEMRYWGLTSNVVTWTGLLHACAKAGWPERAEMVLQRMRDAGIEPNEITFGALVDGWTRIGNIERAFEAVRKMVAVDGVAPNAVLVGGLVEACRRHRDGQSIGKVWQLIGEHNIRPARTYYPTMIALAAWGGDVETAISISSHCYARGFLRRVAFASRDPTLQALAYALVCVSKACERRSDREALMERMTPIFDSAAMDAGGPKIAGMSLDDVFNKVASFWESTAPIQGDVESAVRGSNGRNRGRTANGISPRTTVKQMKARYLNRHRQKERMSRDNASSDISAQ